MYNRHVKFGLKISNHLGKNVRKTLGIFLTHTVVVVAVSLEIIQCSKPELQQTSSSVHQCSGYVQILETTWLVRISG